MTDARQMLDDAGMEVVSLCRGGFFPSIETGEKTKAIDDNKRAIEEAAAIGAPLIVLVCGADPGQPLEESRNQIQAGMQLSGPAGTSITVPVTAGTMGVVTKYSRLISE